VAVALDQTRLLAPGIVRSIIWLYDQPNDLIGPDGIVVGSREIGTAQGCLLLMIVACLALVPVNQKVATTLEEEERRHLTLDADGAGGEIHDEDNRAERRDQYRSVRFSFADDLNIGS
jgi:hypothetical protein